MVYSLQSSGVQQASDCTLEQFNYSTILQHNLSQHQNKNLATEAFLNNNKKTLTAVTL